MSVLPSQKTRRCHARESGHPVTAALSVQPRCSAITGSSAFADDDTEYAATYRTLPLHAHGNTHAAADAERGEALLRIALLHLEQQGRQHARAGRTDRMPQRDGAAVDVDLSG